MARGADRVAASLLLAIVAAAPATRAQTQAPPPAPAPAAEQAPPLPRTPPLQTPAAGDAAARADTLFQEGKRLLEQGQFDAACQLLAQSDALDPTVSALGLLATCHEQQGHLAAAWREYRETAQRAEGTHDARGDFARQRAAALEPRLAKLAVRLARAVPGLEIRLDGELRPESDLGGERVVEPGPHEIALAAPGHVARRLQVVTKEGALVIVEMPELAPLAPPAPPPAPPRADTPRFGPRLPAALTAGGVGLVGLGIGIGFGVSALNQNLRSITIHDTCKAPGAPSGACNAGRDARDGAFHAAAVSTVGFGVAVAGVGAGLVLLLWPRAKAPATTGGGVQVTPLVGAQGGGAVIRGPL